MYVGGEIEHIVLHSRGSRPPDKSEYLIFSLFLDKKYVMGTQKNRLIETVLWSTQNTSLN